MTNAPSNNHGSSSGVVATVADETTKYGSQEEDKKHQWASESIKHNNNETTTQQQQSPSAVPSNNNNNNNDRSSVGVRSAIGHGMGAFTDVVNENLVAFRYGTVATIAILTAYGFANTPLFFRFRTVADIPSSYFVRRKRIKGRIIRVVDSTTNNNNNAFTEEGRPVVCLVRHLSPVGMLLSKKWFDFFMKSRPSVSSLSQPSSSSSSSPTSGRVLSPEERPDELIQVELAGIETPPPYYSSNPKERPVELLRRLAKERTMVSVELLARRVKQTNNEKQNDTISSGSRGHDWDTNLPPPPKRTLAAVYPDLAADDKKNTAAKTRDNRVHRSSFSNNDYHDPEQQLGAVARLYYRPRFHQLFPTDLSKSLVRYGQVNVSSDGLYGNRRNNNSNDSSSGLDDESSSKFPQQQQLRSSSSSSTTNDAAQVAGIVVDATTRTEDIHKDAVYMSELGREEYEAARLGHGMWADPTVRANRRDVVDEVEFQKTAPLWKKLWRKWFRGG